RLMPKTRKSPPRVLKRLQAAGQAVLGTIGAHVLLFGLALIATALIALFFVGLSQISPHSPGNETRLSNATALISQGSVRQAVLRDQDSRLELTTSSGKRFW